MSPPSSRSIISSSDAYGDLSDKHNARRLLDDVSQHPLVKRGNLIEDPEAILARPIATYRDFVEAIFQATRILGKPRWGDKTPFYTPDIDVLHRIFPDAKFLHLVRDGRDVVLSQKSIEWMSGNLPKLILDWRWKTTIAHKVGSVWAMIFWRSGTRISFVTPRPMLRRICSFIDEPYRACDAELFRERRGRRARPKA